MHASVYLFLGVIVAFVNSENASNNTKADAKHVHLKVIDRKGDDKKEPIMASFADVDEVANRAFFDSSTEEIEEDTNRVDFQSYLRMFYEKPWHNPDEEGEGDLIMGVFSRGGLEETKWPNGIVPFKIKEVKESGLKILKQAILLFHKHTCVRFIPRSDEEDYILIDGSQKTCTSYMGKFGQEQLVKLSNRKCFKTFGTPFHELMHVLGFDHEQSREDRDSYVTILKNNISPTRLNNFEKNEKKIAAEVPYDFGSVMHYSFYAFAKNNKQPTMQSLHKLPTNIKVGQRNGPSVFDLKKINILYDCPNKF